jgi:ABC transporter with metal-binding/Fe-S-binding domain ATP-binding protein
VKVAVLSSGGKDSSAAQWWAQCKGWKITNIVTMIVKGNDSLMFQIPSTSLVEHQAKLCGIEWISVSTDGIEETEVSDLENALSVLDIDGIVAGAIRSDYQKNRLERMCERLGIHSFTPLWHQPSLIHMRGLVENGFKVMLTGISAEGLEEDWLGKVLDSKSLKDLESLALKYRFSVDGEGGEYETLVIAGPHMNGSIILDYDTYWDGSRGHISVNSAYTHY